MRLPCSNVPLILVLGHDSCGAVDAAIKSLKDDKPLPGHMPSLVAGIAPAVKAVSQQDGDTLDKAIRQNVIDNVAKLSSATPILSAAVEQRKLKVVGGVYRLEGRPGRYGWLTIVSIAGALHLLGCNLTVFLIIDVARA